MQIDAIKATDYIKGNDDISMFPETVIKRPEKEEKNQELRSISIDNSNYNNKGKSENDFNKKLEEASLVGADLSASVNYVERTTGQDIVGKATEDGFDPMDMDRHTVVTVVDKIKMALAKGGADISMMGGLSDEEIRAMSSSAGQAYAMAAELDSNLSDESKMYLVDNALEPTIENVYNATFKAPASVEPTDEAKAEVGRMLDEMASQLQGIINEIAGISSKEGMEIAGDLLMAKVPVTAKNIEYYNDLNSYEKPSDDKLNQIINDALAEGRTATDAFVVDGYSLMDQAREVFEEVNAIDETKLSDVTARRQLEETRLMMTVEANFALLKRGITLDTSDLSDLVEKLKSQENELAAVMLDDGTGVDLEAKISAFNQTQEVVTDLKEMPAALLGRIPDIADATLNTLHEEGKVLKDTFIKANESYEALMTKPRADLGDSMKKAFRNVDDILADLDLELSDENRKAVRILSYNQLAITKESVEGMRNASEEVNRTFKSLTPAVVTEMIKRGENPLDMKISDLNKLANDIKSETGSSSDEEGFAKFLYKLEHTEGISEDERNSYIGVYRLIHQVEAGDGAAVGALVHAGEDVTLRNLMTAVRSSKHSNKEYAIDDSFGHIEKVNVKDLSITEQIEAAFNINRLRDAKEAMAPSKFSQFAKEDDYMDLTADQFATAMESVDDVEAEESYQANIANQMLNAHESEERINNILRQFDLPDSANMIEAMNLLMSDRNGIFAKLFEKQAKNQVENASGVADNDTPLDALKQIMSDIIEEMGEDAKTPEEMAKAQNKLAEMAESVMDNMINEEEVTSIDLRGMKLIKTSIKAMSVMAEKSQTYHIPVMVADEVGNMTLKIVSGKEEKGLVDVALDINKYGKVSASFKYEKTSVSANFNCENEDTARMINEKADELISAISTATQLPVEIAAKTKNVDINAIYNVESEEVVSEITTSQLYSIARSFINVFPKVFS